jgi:hypothetical protein
MNEITITIRYAGEKQSVPTQDDILLEDLLQQLSDRGSLPQNQNWVVTKKGADAALDLGATLAANNVVDGDILDLALPTKAG